MNYTPEITVLHIEDERYWQDKLKKQLVGRGIYCYAVASLEEAKDILKKCRVQFIISDGAFPNKKGGKQEKLFLNVAKIVPKNTELIAWANSTHVHEYCKKHGIEHYSKGQLAKEMFTRKGREYVKTRKIMAGELAASIGGKLLEKARSMINTKVELVYREPATVLGASLASDARTAMFKETAGKNYSTIVGEISKGTIGQLQSLEEDRVISDMIYRKVLKGHFPTLRKNVMQRAAKLKRFSRSLRKMEYAILTNSQLARLYSKFCMLFMQMRKYSSLPTAMEHVTSVFTKKLKSILQGRADDEIEVNKALSALTTPRQPSYILKYDLACTKAGLGKKSTAKVAEEFAWVRYSFEGTPITAKDVQERIRGLGKTKKELQEVIEQESKREKEVERTKKELAKRYQLTKEEKELFEIGAQIVSIKFYRKGVFAEAYYCVESLLKEIGKRIGLRRGEVANMLPKEVLAALETGGFPREIIKRRMKESIVVYSKGESISILTAGRTLHEAVQKEGVSELKGQVACPGKAKGKVAIVNTPEDMPKLKKGDILVSRSTNPSIVPAMERAAAFVTDIGGLTCHAAIVAREMNKPCIVGTGIATSALKDGDIVEVDADKGVVKVER